MFFMSIAENIDPVMMLMFCVQDTKEDTCLRLFLDYHGLKLIWSWMVDLPPSAQQLRKEILRTLNLLPIRDRTILADSKVLVVVQKWAHQMAKESEEAGDSSSRSDTPSTTSAADSTKPVEGVEALPHKKRRLLQHAMEEATSSDSELSDSNKTLPRNASDTELAGKMKLDADSSSQDEGESQASDTDGGKDSEAQPGQAPKRQDSTEGTDKPEYAEMATDLLSNWSSLKVRDMRNTVISTLGPGQNG